MFRHTHRIKHKQKKILKGLTGLIQMSRGSLLLEEPKFVTLLHRLTLQCEMVDRVSYESCYQPLIEAIVSYVDKLPDSTHRFYDQLGGYLEHIFLRTEVALNLLKPYLLIDKNRLSKEQACWHYALFSAGLLCGLGKLYIDYQVKLYDKTGVFQTFWNPLVEGLHQTSYDYYTYELSQNANISFRKRLNSVLAIQIIPKEGFDWLASVPEVFETWLALLSEAQGEGRVFEAILTRAEHLLLTESLELLLKNLLTAKSQTFLSTDASATDLMTQAGILFLQWLKNQLASGELVLNEGPLSLNDEGLRMDPDVFKLFVRDNPGYKNWEAVQKGFKALGFHDLHVNTAEILFSKFGIVLPGKVRVRNPLQNQTTWLTALEVQHFFSKKAQLAATDHLEKVAEIPKLSDKGVWQKSTSLDYLKPGSHYRG